MADTNGHASTLVNDDPLLLAMDSLKDAGVLDTPSRIDALSKSLRASTEQASSKALRLEQENAQLRNELAEVRGSVEGMAKSLQTIAQMVSNRPEPVQQQPNQTVLNLSASGLAEQLGEVLTKCVADVIYKTLERAVSSPVTNVSMDVEALGLTIAGQMAPLLKSLSDRPEPLAPIVDVAAPNVQVDLTSIALALEKSLGGMVERMTQPPAQVQVSVDTEGIAEAVGKAIGKSMERFAERMRPQDLAPILKRLDEQGERIDKSLGSIASRPQPRQKRISHDPDTGDLIVTQE